MSAIYSLNDLAADFKRFEAAQAIWDEPNWGREYRKDPQEILGEINRKIGSNYLKIEFLADCWRLATSGNTKLFSEMRQKLELNRKERTFELLMKKFYSKQIDWNPLNVVTWKFNDNILLPKQTRRNSEFQFNQGLERLEKHRDASGERTIFAIATGVSWLFTSLVPALCVGAVAAGVEKFASIYRDLGDSRPASSERGK